MSIISKELLSEVLGVELVYFDDCNEYMIPYKESKTEYCLSGNEDMILVNIHELAHKCKIKAIEWGYVVIEYPNFVTIHKDGKKEITEKFGDLSTEHYRQERVFKATQWILDNV